MSTANTAGTGGRSSRSNTNKRALARSSVGLGLVSQPAGGIEIVAVRNVPRVLRPGSPGCRCCLHDDPLPGCVAVAQRPGCPPRSVDQPDLTVALSPLGQFNAGDSRDRCVKHRATILVLRIAFQGFKIDVH